MPIPIRMVVLLTLFALTKDSFFHARTPPQQSRTSININEHQITLGFNRLCQESNSGSNGRLDAIFALTRLFRLGRTPAQQSTINNQQSTTSINANTSQHRFPWCSIAIHCIKEHSSPPRMVVLTSNDDHF